MRSTLWSIAFMTLIAGTVTAQEVLFKDDFDSGLSPAWSNPDGGWVARNGHLEVTSACGQDACNPNLFGGGPEQQKYTIAFDFMVSESFSVNGAVVRGLVAMSDPVEPDEGTPSGYVVSCGRSAEGIPDQAVCTIQRFDKGTATTLAEAMGSEFWIETGTVYRIKLGRTDAGVAVKLWNVDKPEPAWMLVAADESYQSGYWMPSFWNQLGWIDNFEVSGAGMVPDAATAWGAVKARYR